MSLCAFLGLPNLTIQYDIAFFLYHSLSTNFLNLRFKDYTLVAICMFSNK